MASGQTNLVQTSFAQVAPVAKTTATLFYDRLFGLNPSLRGLFKEVLREQRMKLMAMLTVAANNLHQWAAVALHVKQLGLPHVGHAVKPADYDTAGIALIDMLEKRPGEAFAPAVGDAWFACYTTIVPEMRAVEQTETVKP